jgi:hypothetical protein
MAPLLLAPASMPAESTGGAASMITTGAESTGPLAGGTGTGAELSGADTSMTTGAAAATTGSGAGWSRHHASPRDGGRTRMPGGTDEPPTCSCTVATTAGTRVPSSSAISIGLPTGIGSGTSR